MAYWRTSWFSGRARLEFGWRWGHRRARERASVSRKWDAWSGGCAGRIAAAYGMARLDAGVHAGDAAVYATSLELSGLVAFVRATFHRGERRGSIPRGAAL